MESTVVYGLMAFNAVLVAMVAFFLKQLMGKFDNVERSINDLNIRIAEIMTSQEHHVYKFEKFDKFEGRIDKEQKDIRERIHSLTNNLQEYRFEAMSMCNTNRGKVD